LRNLHLTYPQLTGFAIKFVCRSQETKVRLGFPI